MREVREYFTAEELVEIMSGVGLEVRLEIDDEGDVMMRFSNGGQENELFWHAYLGAERPFYDYVLLISGRFAPVDPYHFANWWNHDHVFSTAVSVDVIDDDNDADEDGGEDEERDDPFVSLRFGLTFDGGVTVEHLGHVLRQWHDDVCDFLDPDLIQVEEDAGEPDPEIGDGLTLEQSVEAVLRIRSGRSAREIGRILDVKKHLVNRVLYAGTETFEMQPGQPPRWALKAP